ncbi:MAG: hypothetical protein ACTS85_02505 [Arsenophonus sp. NC-PG7-MAG3]
MQTGKNACPEWMRTAYQKCVDICYGVTSIETLVKWNRSIDLNWPNFYIVNIKIPINEIILPNEEIIFHDKNALG